MTKELVDKLRKTAVAVYLATDDAVADNISVTLKEAANVIENLEKAIAERKSL